MENNLLNLTIGELAHAIAVEINKNTTPNSGVSISEYNKVVAQLKEARKKLNSNTDSKNNDSELIKENQVLKKKINQLEEELNNAKSSSYSGDLSDEEIEDLRRLAFMDSMTGIKNNNAFNIDYSRVKYKDCVLAMIDVCKLKEINITFGREAGDNVIITAARILADEFGADNIYRIMGDRFIVLTQGLNESTVKNKISIAIETMKNQSITVNYGMCDGLSCEGDADLIVERTRNALYQSKNEPVPISFHANHRKEVVKEEVKMSYEESLDTDGLEEVED